MAVATLAAGMAHEIKNPLTSIKTFAEYLPEKYDDPNFRNNFQRIVVEEVDRVNSIVKQLLDFSKPQELILEKKSVKEIIDETLMLMNSDFLNNGINLIKDYQDQGYILVDRKLLKQAFLNVFLNNIQAMPNGGMLKVQVRKENEYIKITLSDTGCGISNENLKQIFNPFFTTKESGTGLGLSIVKSIIEQHKGIITYTSELGKGTTTLILLPISSLMVN